jgi:hypothetical protein
VTVRPAVAFRLGGHALRISHFGKPFDERDMRGISGIAEGTKGKDLTTIGRFGIGFKSVYAFTDRPEVHSGAEDFAIQNFVWPAAAPRVERNDDQTLISLPLKSLCVAARLAMVGHRQGVVSRTARRSSFSMKTGRDTATRSHFPPASCGFLETTTWHIAS